MNLDYDTFWVQTIDRATSSQLLAMRAGPPDGTIAYEREMLVLDAAAEWAYVYIYSDVWDAEHGWFLRASVDAE